MLVLVGFSATALYWPGIAAAATAPRWAALFLLVPWLIRGDAAIRAPHVIGLSFIALAGLSLLWSSSPLDGMQQLFLLLLCASLFWVGSESRDLRGFYIGAGIGLSLSSAVAVVQLFGWHPLPELWNQSPPAGLFINGNYLAEAAGLVVVAAVSQRIWWLLPLLLPSLLLPHGRGALLAVGVAGVLYFWRKSTIASAIILGLIVAGLLVLLARLPFDHTSLERLAIWHSAWNGVTIWGHGIGSFLTSYPAFDLRVNPMGYPQYAHNELLNIAFELGVPGVLLALAFCATLAGPLDTSRLVLIALAVEAFFAFPLHLPATAAIGFLAAGHAVRNRYLLCAWAFGRRGTVAPRVVVPGRFSWFVMVFGKGRPSVSVRAPIPGPIGAHASDERASRWPTVTA